MFDTPDLAPLCIAPGLGIVLGAFLHIGGSAIGYLVRRNTGYDPKWIKEAFSFLAVSAAIIACIYSLFLGIGTREHAPLFKPTNESIVGSWQLSPRDHFSIPIPPQTLAFRGDGTFYMENIPQLWGLKWDMNPVQYINGSGSWHVDADRSLGQKEWAIIAQFNTINGKADRRVMRFYFTGYVPPYVLSYIVDGIYEFVKK